MSSTKYNVFGIGNALLDIECQVDFAFLKQFGIEKGHMTLIDAEREFLLFEALSPFEVKRCLGGSAANSIVAANALGSKAYYCCKVALGDDRGRYYINDLQQLGIHTNMSNFTLKSESYQGKTGVCLVMVTPDAERTMNTYLGISETLGLEQLDLHALHNSEYIYVEGYMCTSPTARVLCQKAFQAVRSHTQPNAPYISLGLSDPSMPKYFRPQLLEMMSDAKKNGQCPIDLLFCNEEEARIFTQTQNQEAAVRELKNFATNFCMTKGSQGVFIYNGLENKIYEMEAYPTKVVDTNGAGDMFAGTFLYGITHGLGFEKSGQLANYCASKIVAQFGPRFAPNVQAQFYNDFMKGNTK